MQPSLDPLTLLVDDPAQPLLEVTQYRVEVRAFQFGLPPATELVQDPPQPGDVTAARPPHAALHQALQRPADVAFGQDVLAQCPQDVVRIERRQLLRAVPT